MVSRSWLPLLTLLALAACSREPSTPAAPPAGRPAAAPTDLLAVVPKDAGKAWAADAHTREQIGAMAAAVQAAAGDASQQATQALGKRLQEIAGKLMAGCTMGGAAHEALHEYLGVLLPRLTAMTGPDAAAAQQARGEVAAVLGRFGEYFQ